MSENSVKWHPYPEEKPLEEKEYLISFYDWTRKRYGVDLDFYNPEHDVWDVYGDGVYTRVTAWAERPEPYKEPELLDMHQDAITARKYMEGDPETIKNYTFLTSRKMNKLMDLVDFDINDEKTYPKREGTYLVISEFGKLNVAFWCEIEKVRNSSEFGIRKNPRWVYDIDCPKIKKFCPTPLSELDWTTGAKYGHTA